MPHMFTIELCAILYDHFGKEYIIPGGIIVVIMQPSATLCFGGLRLRVWGLGFGLYM